jgi:serine/threonine protein kinase
MVGRVFLGRYEAIRLLGEGGMGRVYLARQLDLRREVVVKVMHDHIAVDPKFQERFSRETLLMARFQHPYAVTLYDASLDDPSGPCIIMEYIRGVTVDTLLRNNHGRLNPFRVGRLVEQLCEVLQAAHATGIIHRDLKPSNLMVVDPDTPHEKIKVMDFGLAKLHGQASAHDSNDSGAEFVVGTPAYICPEQIRNQETDHRGDLYSVGVILYQMLTGKLPFAGTSTMDILLAQAHDSPPPFADVGAANTVSPAIERVILMCLAKDPDERPQNARELAQLYEEALTERPELPEATPAEPEPTDGHQPAAPKRPLDPKAVVHHLEAWMPATIAAFKLRGFVHDVGGEVVESTAGLIRVRLGPESAYRLRNSAFSWLGIGRKPEVIELELGLEQAASERQNQLNITVQMRSLHGESAADSVWRARCDQIYCDLRAYLMGQNGRIDDRAG